MFLRRIQWFYEEKKKPVTAKSSHTAAREICSTLRGLQLTLSSANGSSQCKYPYLVSSVGAAVLRPLRVDAARLRWRTTIAWLLTWAENRVHCLNQFVSRMKMLCFCLCVLWIFLELSYIPNSEIVGYTKVSVARIWFSAESIDRDHSADGSSGL